MSLFLRKLLSNCFLPLPIALALILIGLLLAWRFKKTGIITASIGYIILLCFSLTPIANWLTFKLEKKYTPVRHVRKNINTILVLGGGVRVNPKQGPANTQLASSSLSRLIEGIRLYRLLQTNNQPVKLILSGGRIFNSPDVSGVMRNTAVMLGVSPKNLVLESGSINTLEEARHLKKTLGERPFLLVTSAYHMRRSMALFKSQGLHPIAAPTQYLAKANNYMPAHWLIPNAKNLARNDLALHEYLGLLWAEVSGEIPHTST